MKTSQKGSVAVTVLLVIILLVLAGVGVYLYQRRAQAPAEVTTTVPEQASDTTSQAPTTAVPTTQPGAPALPPHSTSTDPITKVYSDKKFGFSTTYPKAYTVSVDKAGKVTLSIPNAQLASMTIVEATGSADTSTGKWGKNVLSYSKSGWVTELQDESGKTYSAATTPFAYTTSGLPIFNGGTRHGFGLSVYVVALSDTKFLIISGGEGLTTPSGYDYSTDPTLKIAKAVTLL